MADGPHNGAFSIVHHMILDDTKFEAIYGDDTLLATWLRLLIEADKAWPSPAALPYGTNPDALATLVAKEIVDELPHHQYFIHGMAAERARRTERFRLAAEEGWRKRRGGDAHATH